MKVIIYFDPDGSYGYPKNETIECKQLVEDYIDCLNDREDADTISFLKKQPVEKAVDFVAKMWGLDYDFI